MDLSRGEIHKMDMAGRLRRRRRETKSRRRIKEQKEGDLEEEERWRLWRGP